MTFHIDLVRISLPDATPSADIIYDTTDLDISAGFSHAILTHSSVTSMNRVAEKPGLDLFRVISAQ